MSALGYMLDTYSPRQQAELHIGSVLGASAVSLKRVPWLDRIASLVVGGGLSVAATQLQAPSGTGTESVCPPSQVPHMHAGDTLAAKSRNSAATDCTVVGNF